jgi:hypothetical protein
MKIVNRFLPEAGGEEGNRSCAGGHLPRRAPEWLTRMADQAVARNNETTKSL